MSFGYPPFYLTADGFFSPFFPLQLNNSLFLSGIYSLPIYLSRFVVCFFLSFLERELWSFLPYPSKESPPGSPPLATVRGPPLFSPFPLLTCRCVSSSKDRQNLPFFLVDAGRELPFLLFPPAWRCLPSFFPPPVYAVLPFFIHGSSIQRGAFTGSHAPAPPASFKGGRGILPSPLLGGLAALPSQKRVPVSSPERTFPLSLCNLLSQLEFFFFFLPRGGSSTFPPLGRSFWSV